MKELRISVLLFGVVLYSVSANPRNVSVKKHDKRDLSDFHGFDFENSSEELISSDWKPIFPYLEQEVVPGVTHEVEEVTITKEIQIPVPITVEKEVRVPVAIHVDQPYPVYISKPIPFAVHKPVPYQVKIPVPSPYIIEKKVPVAVNLDKKSPVTFNYNFVNKQKPNKNAPFGFFRKIVSALVGKPLNNIFRQPLSFHNQHKHITPSVVKHIPYPVEKYFPVPIKVPVPYEVNKYVQTQDHKEEGKEELPKEVTDYLASVLPPKTGHPGKNLFNHSEEGQKQYISFKLPGREETYSVAVPYEGGEEIAQGTHTVQLSQETSSPNQFVFQYTQAGSESTDHHSQSPYIFQESNNVDGQPQTQYSFHTSPHVEEYRPQYPYVYQESHRPFHPNYSFLGHSGNSYLNQNSQLHLHIDPEALLARYSSHSNNP